MIFFPSFSRLPASFQREPNKHVNIRNAGKKLPSLFSQKIDQQRSGSRPARSNFCFFFYKEKRGCGIYIPREALLSHAPLIRAQLHYLNHYKKQMGSERERNVLSHFFRPPKQNNKRKKVKLNPQQQQQRRPRRSPLSSSSPGGGSSSSSRGPPSSPVPPVGRRRPRLLRLSSLPKSSSSRSRGPSRASSGKTTSRWALSSA